MIPRWFKVGKVPHHMVLDTSFYMCKIGVPRYPGQIHVVSRYHCKGAPIDADVARKRGENLVVNADDLWVTSMKEKLASMNCKSFSPSTICRVPTNICKDDRAAYSPKIVSIGPYHRGSRDLEGMEQQKWRYLREVLTHSTREKELEKYLKEMTAIEPLARSCYTGNIDMGMENFVEMMLLDACFTIHLLRQKEQKDDARKDDPIYSNSWMLPQIRHDMLLLENQLPFFVLECLCDLIGQPRATLKEQALSFFRTVLPDEPDLKPPKASDVHHFLHLLHLSLEPENVGGGGTAKRTPFQLCAVIEKIIFFLYPKHLAYAYKQQQSVKTIPTAMGLQEAGVKFKTKQSRSFLDVTFEHGMMQVPHLRISNFTNSLLRNFIALEQCFPHYGSDFTSYCFFMDSLVNTPRDVEILNRSEIIEHVLGSDEEVALLFNKLCKGIDWDFANSDVAKMFQQVTEYTRTRCHTWRAKLMHEYFSNPWAIFSTIAAMVALILTFLQTYYTIWPLKSEDQCGSGGGSISNNNYHNNSPDDNDNGIGHGGGGSSNNNDHNNSLHDNGGGGSNGGGGGGSGSNGGGSSGGGGGTGGGGGSNGGGGTGGGGSNGGGGGGSGSNGGGSSGGGGGGGGGNGGGSSGGGGGGSSGDGGDEHHE